MSHPGVCPLEFFYNLGHSSQLLYLPNLNMYYSADDAFEVKLLKNRKPFIIPEISKNKVQKNNYTSH